MIRRFGWLSALLLLTRCFGSDVPAGALRCDETFAHPCPSGMVCLAGRCEDPNAALDSGVDGPHDGPLADASPGDVGDAMPDLPQGEGLPPFSCSIPEIVGNTTEDLLEPAVRTEGLKVVARSGNNYFVTTRPSRGEPFGDWEPDTIFTDGSDPTFFYADGKERAIRAYGSPRHLELCEIYGSCSTIVLVDFDGGAAISSDVDGPSVADGLAEPLLVFDRNASLWLGPATNAGTFDHFTVEVLAFRGSDPAISPDGLILVFERTVVDVNGELLVARRKHISDPFSEPELLSEINSVAPDNEPDLIAAPGGGVELFFRSKRSGTNKIYHSFCQ